MNVTWDDRDISLRQACVTLAFRESFRLTVEAAPGTTAWEWLVWPGTQAHATRRFSKPSNRKDGESAIGGWSDSVGAAKAAAEAALHALLARSEALAA